nr:PREDICTED: uncharacterized protein LOC107397988 [Tribolium castaneum]|eukprot:XP_015835905.1 PREDICTED: uncharacterized protein LOC107397988 [Tribolium castaneum]
MSLSTICRLSVLILLFCNCAKSLECLWCSDPTCSPQNIHTITCERSRITASIYKCYLSAWRLPNGSYVEQRGCVGENFKEMLRNCNFGKNVDYNQKFLATAKDGNGTQCVLCTTHLCNHKPDEERKSSAVVTNVDIFFYFTLIFVLHALGII